MTGKLFIPTVSEKTIQCLEGDEITVGRWLATGEVYLEVWDNEDNETVTVSLNATQCRALAHAVAPPESRDG